MERLGRSERTKGWRAFSVQGGERVENFELDTVNVGISTDRKILTEPPPRVVAPLIS